MKTRSCIYCACTINTQLEVPIEVSEALKLGDVDLLIISAKTTNEIAMPRLMIAVEHRSKLRAILLEDRVYDKPKKNNTEKGILYRMRVSCPWRDLPESFEIWNTVFRRFLLWSRKGLLKRLFKKLISEPDFDC